MEMGSVLACSYMREAGLWMGNQNRRLLHREKLSFAETSSLLCLRCPESCSELSLAQYGSYRLALLVRQESTTRGG